MQITFHYDKKAVINGLRFHFLNRTETKVIRVLFVLLFIIAIWGYLKNVLPYAVVVIVFVLIVLLSIVLWLILPNTIYRKAKTFHEHAIVLEYDEEGLSIGTHAGARQLPWQSFSRVIETDYFFYLYRSNNAFFLIPADAFTPEERNDFRELLHRHFDKYKVKNA
jgi:hypothetical protein